MTLANSIRIASVSAVQAPRGRFDVVMENQRNFAGEINIHFPGLKGLDKPTVWVFPKLVVCFDCGFTEFLIPESANSLLIQREH